MKQQNNDQRENRKQDQQNDQRENRKQNQQNNQQENRKNNVTGGGGPKGLPPPVFTGAFPHTAGTRMTQSQFPRRWSGVPSSMTEKPCRW